MSKENLRPFNLEEALKNPERVVHVRSDLNIIEWPILVEYRIGVDEYTCAGFPLDGIAGAKHLIMYRET